MRENPFILVHSLEPHDRENPFILVHSLEPHDREIMAVKAALCHQECEALVTLYPQKAAESSECGLQLPLSVSLSLRSQPIG